MSFLISSLLIVTTILTALSNMIVVERESLGAYGSTSLISPGSLSRTQNGHRFRHSPVVWSLGHLS
jgi:hypothetical protein